MIFTTYQNYPLALSMCIFYFSAVVNASQAFYNATTSVPVDRCEPKPPKRFTKTLNLTSNPKEKRKIIADTFLQTAEDVCVELNLKPEDTILAQGKLASLVLRCSSSQLVH